MTRSANDAAVVIAEAIAGDEDDFAKLMTRKARALGMTKTVYRNASGLPERRAGDHRARSVDPRPRHPGSLPALLPLFLDQRRSTIAAMSIRNHNRLLGSVEGVDGIKTGYTRASGFNLVTSMRRGNRHLVGVVLGGRSGGSRDAIMRNLLAENLEKAATKRTVAAITERNAVGRQCRRRRSRCRRAADADGSGPGRRAGRARPAAGRTAPRVDPHRLSRAAVLAAATAAVPPPGQTSPDRSHDRARAAAPVA